MSQPALPLSTRVRRLCRPGRLTGLAALVGLALSLVPAPASASMMLACYLGYLSFPIPNPSPGHHDRGCTFALTFRDPINPAPSGLLTRAYSCHVASGASSCFLTIDPTASGVPATYNLVGADTSPLDSATEESDGCGYSGYEHGSASLVARYPLVFGGGDPPPGASVNPYPYAATDPMPARTGYSSPYPLSGGVSVPTIPVGGSGLYTIVALHYFDCATLP
jgi:hypothetical protein